MLKKSFFSRQDPAVTLLMRGGSIEEIIANARKGEFEGADCQTPYKLNCLVVAGTMPFEPHSTERRLFKNEI